MSMKVSVLSVLLAGAVFVSVPASAPAGAFQDAESKVKEAGEKTKQGAKNVGEETKEGAEKVADKTKEVAGTAGRKTKEGLSKTGEVMTDAWIKGRVSSRFVPDDLLKGSDIDVDVNDHVVKLTGTVTSAAAKAKAAQIVRRTEGVHKVVNQLTIGPKT